MKIALIPIDNRPVCYNLVRDIANIDSALELFLPDKKLLGSLRSNSDVEGILSWLDNLENVDVIVVSLDTIAYGGLIPSRRSKDSLEEVKNRLELFKNKLKNKCKKVYAFSSIMRISNNNINEEEKPYWDKYGTKIFEYSYKFHHDGEETKDIPEEILCDYLATRQRNFSINKMYLEWLKEGVFDTLVFSKDDCAEYGMNVLEAEILKRIVKEQNLNAQNKSVFVKTGADEIPLTLLARAVCDSAVKCGKALKISTKFLEPEYKDLVSNYEDISIEKCVQEQIELAGGKVSPETEADIILIVNNFELLQGEIVMGVKTKPFDGKLDLPKGDAMFASYKASGHIAPFIIADVRFANGADNKFVGNLLKKKLDFEKFYGYSAWNTSANTLGSLICAAVVRFFAKNFNEDAFKKLQMIRFLDDWAYQANVRQVLKKPPSGSQSQTRKSPVEVRPDVRKLKKLMLPYEKKLNKSFGTKFKIKYAFPWRRFFEVKVKIDE